MVTILFFVQSCGSLSTLMLTGHQPSKQGITTITTIMIMTTIMTEDVVIRIIDQSGFSEYLMASLF